MKNGFGDRVRARLASQRGFTLIEVLVSALLVTLIATAVAGALITNTDIIANQNSRSQAEVLAEQDQERLKGLSAEQLDNLSQTYTAKAGSNSYTITSKAWYLSTSNGQSCTSAGGASATYFKTISTVTHTSAAGTVQTLATDESVISPDAGGSLLVQFHDQTASPLSGVALSATGPESDSGTSDSTGCVIFSGLDSGTYNLTYTDIGYVDPNGNPSPLADTATVASTGITAPGKGNPIELGQAAGFQGSYKTNGGSNTAYADGLSWFSSGGAGIPMAAYRTNASSLSSTGQTVTASTPTSVNGLFPFVSSTNPVSYTNNYQIWAGTCRQEQPPAGYDTFTVQPGQSLNGQQVLEPTLQLSLTFNGSPKAPNDVKVFFTSGTGNTCTDTWGNESAPSPTAIGGTNYYLYGLPFASSATSGSAASGSGQTGSLTVCADYKSGSTYYSYTQPSTSAFTDSFGSNYPLSIALTSTGSTKKQC
ncbi:MAG TPA: type II secretion system protein [Solirubrobacteraceae bacterium]|nr:type II secretion system protein [Solirubrobacteraceae bacterium]